MTENKKNLDDSWDPDTAPEWPDEVWDRAEISIGGKVVRKATGTLAKRGRPPVGTRPKQQVTLRLPSEVIAYFKSGGPGWQTRVSDVLECYTAKDKRKHTATH